MHYDLFRDKARLLKVVTAEKEGIYIKFSGDTRKEIFYLGTMQPGADPEEALQRIVSDLKILEKGVLLHYGPTKREEIFYGGAMQFAGK